MEQENSNDIRPAPQPAPASDHPDEYYIIKISKRKVHKFIKISLIIMFILSIWMNLAFMHAMKHEMRGMSIHMSYPRRAQFEINRGGAYGAESFSPYYAPGESDNNNSDTYNFDSNSVQNGYFSRNFRIPSR